jgi:hypothetical protein
MNRRRVVQRLGLALSVPMIASVLAPTPLMARSGRPKKPKKDK